MTAKLAPRMVVPSDKPSPLTDKFTLCPLPQLIEEVRQQNAFERYDLTREWGLLTDYVGRFRNARRRDPFTYELLEDILHTLDSNLAMRLKRILFEKDSAWFAEVGQYLFYNVFQWAQGFPESPDRSQTDFARFKLPAADSMVQSLPTRQEFLDLFFARFCEIDESPNSPDSNRSPLPPNPAKVLLELTNNCNLNCIMCGVGKNGYDPARTLPLDFICSWRDDFLKEASWIRLNGLGESTFIPEFLDYLKILSDLPGKLEIVTNLTVQDEKVWQALLDAGTFFLISCDSADPTHYEIIRRGAKFAWFERNLHFIGQNLTTSALAQVIFTLQPDNIDDLVGVIDLVAENGLGGVIVNVAKFGSENWLKGRTENIMRLFHIAHFRAHELGVSLKLPDHLGEQPVDPAIATPSAKAACKNPWEEVYVRYNGDLTACNMLNPYIYGNLVHTKFTRVWNGINANLFRSFLNTQFCHPYCRGCYFLT